MSPTYSLRISNPPSTKEPVFLLKDATPEVAKSYWERRVERSRIGIEETADSITIIHTHKSGIVTEFTHPLPPTAQQEAAAWIFFQGGVDEVIEESLARICQECGRFKCEDPHGSD